MTSDGRMSLAGGVLGEKLWGRRDITKYGVSCAAAENMFVEAEGLMTKRAGTIYSANIATVDHKLIRFKFDADEQYILVFTNLAMKVQKAGTLNFVQSGGSDYSIVTPYATAHLRDLRIVSKGDVSYIMHPLYAVRSLTRLADDNWSLATVTFEPAIDPPTSPSATFTTPTGASASRNSWYKVATVSEAGEESLPTAAFQESATSGTGQLDLSWTAATGASYYVIYKLENGFYGYIGKTETTAFVDDGIDPDTADGPQGERNPFSTTGEYPGVGARWQQRLLYGNRVNTPLRVDASQTGSLDNFNYSTPQVPTDAFDLTIDAEIQGEIRHLVNLGGMFALTSEQVVEIRPTEGNVAQPGQIEAVARLEIGASAVEPVKVVDHIIFVEDTGRKIQSIRRDDVYIEKVIPSERSIMAPHYFAGRQVVRMAYARSPHSIIATVFDDGSCVVMTYVPEHDAWGWARWSSAATGLFLDVECVREDYRDVLYFSIQRTIDGSDVVYLEKLAELVDDPDIIEDAVFVDSAVVYEGSATGTISGCDHLEGEEVVGLADGKVFRGVTVSGGQVTLPSSAQAEKIVVGLDYKPQMQTLPPARDRAKLKGIPTVFVDVYRSSTVKAGPALDKLTTRNPEFPTTFGQKAQLRSGYLEITVDGSYGRESQIWIEGADPLPFSIRGYELEVVQTQSSGKLR